MLFINFDVIPNSFLDLSEGLWVGGKVWRILVLSIVSGGRDYEVTVDFDNVGVKKMFAGFAKLQKI